MGRDNKQVALVYLIKQADNQGYVTFDNIIDCADAHSLTIQEFDWLSNSITTRGILVYDENPINKISVTPDDEDHDDYAQIDYEKIYRRIIELDESLKEFVEEVRRIVPPQRRELSTLKYQVIEGNLHARSRMIEMHLRIALKLALQRAETYDMDIQDAVGEACVGLVIAVDKYNPDTNGAFSSYASMWILQNLARRQSTRRPLMYYPVNKINTFFIVYPFLKECGYIDDPEAFETDDIVWLLKTKYSLVDEQIKDIFAALTPFESYEDIFHNAIEVHELHNGNITYSPVLDPQKFQYDIDSYVDDRMLRYQIFKSLDSLTKTEKKVIILRYGLADGYSRTLEEIGIQFGVTRERIRQIQKSALSKLRHPSRSRYLNDYYN